VTQLDETAVRWSEQDAVDFERTLTPENLAAIMRASSTVDDRVLRHELAELLVDLAVSHAVEVTSPGAPRIAGPVRRMTRQRKLVKAARFLTQVLGPRLIADTGQPNTFELSDAVLAVPSLGLVSGTERTALLTVADHVLTTGAHVEVDDVEATPGIGIPRQHGGDGRGPCEIGAVMETLGREVARSTFFATSVFATYTLSELGDGPLLASIAAGAVTATLAAAGGDCRATPTNDGWEITGRRSFVLDACTADVLVVAATTPTGPALFAVRADARGLVTWPMAVLDPTRPLGELDLVRTEARLVGRDPTGEVVARVLDRSCLALAAEQVGVAQSCLELAVDHLADVGAGEVDRLAIAEIYLQVTAARAIAGDAAEQAAGRGADAAAVRAHLCCSQTAVSVANRAMRIVGEPATADDHPLQPRYRRALSSKLLFGGTHEFHERLLARLGI
jgi:alkylation response protein AidB-like acyl-CoA dehydrogenase